MEDLHDLRSEEISAQVYLAENHFPSSPRRATAGPLGPGRTFSYSVIKRILDIVLVIASFPIVLPLGSAIAVIVMITSPGPIFFSHRRIGRNGIFFSMWKFRTMCTNSAEVLERHLALHPEDRITWNRDHKLRNDPRITPIGCLLRKSSLDELPQLWNILTGKMSLVGPRPIIASEVEKYDRDFAYYLSVIPGLTGLWQCSGRSSVSYETRVKLDRRYVETWSLVADIKILCKTCLQVLQFKDAA